MSNNIDQVIKMLEEAKLELRLNKVTTDMEVALLSNEIYMEFVDKEYEDKLRDMELINQVTNKMLNLTKISTMISEIEQEAIKINSQDIFWKCESKRAKILSQIELLRNKYAL